MDIGFETIGNATLICHDRGPVLVTDPWIKGDAYFGSWTFSHQIPEEQLAAISQCSYVWISHGHPDHLSGQSLEHLKDKKILIPDHVGRRIYDGLRAAGFDVHILRDRTWTPVSDRIRILSLADNNQDAILLVDLDGKLIVNLNDAQEAAGWGTFVRSVIKGFPVSFLMCLSGYGDADMINFFDQAGNRVIPEAAARKDMGAWIQSKAERFGVRYFIPFSSMHCYQRSDSFWANVYTTGLEDYAKGFRSSACEILPAFVRYYADRDKWEAINPAKKEIVQRAPEDFGDHWSEPLEPRDEEDLKKYFQTVAHLHDFLDFINVRVGGKDHRIEIAKQGFNRGLQFEVPRNSLMLAVRHQIWDDLLIGNFMKTTLLGNWEKQGRSALYPDFSPYMRYADNGRAKSKKETDAYMAEYRKRAVYDQWKSRLGLLFKDPADFGRRTQNSLRRFVGRYF